MFRLTNKFNPFLKYPLYKLLFHIIQTSIIPVGNNCMALQILKASRSFTTYAAEERAAVFQRVGS